MVLEPDFIDISSSDDEEEDHSLGRNGLTGQTELLNFSKVFNMDVEDDDVVIIDKPTTTGNVKRDKARPIRSAMDDDECFMLDSDPSAFETTDIASPLDSDELVMIGEKGHVACRDFPHARYLCVHFAFKTTPHASFCTQCHCYVCDSLAPCSQWGDGNSPNDHCHASEESRWRTLRKLAKCGSVPSRAIPITAPTATPLSDLNGIGNPTGVNRFVLSSTPPISQSAISPSPIGRPVSSGVSRQVQGMSTAVKKDPLIIKLKAIARGKPSQPPHLGVRSPRYLPGNRSALPQPRTSSAPSGRVGDEVLPPGVQPAQFVPYLNHGPGSGTVADMPPHHSPSMSAFNTVSGRAGVAVMLAPVHFSQSNGAPCCPALTPPIPNNPPPVHFSQATVNSIVAPSYYASPAPPPPNSPPPYIPPPPSGAYNPSPPGAYKYSPPGLYDHNFVRLPGADETIAGFAPPVSHIPDSRYVFASALSAQQGICNVNTAAFYEDHSSVQPYDYLAQGYRIPVHSAHYRSSGYISSNGGDADILAGATEGWVVAATAHFDGFPSGIIGTAPDHDKQGASSLNDVLEQLAGDDYLWEQFSFW